MAKNWIERKTGHWPRWAQQARDQAGHVVWAALWALVVALSVFWLSRWLGWSGVERWAGLCGFLASLARGGVREFRQNWGDKDNDYRDMALDLACWTLGATAGFVVPV